MSTLETDVIQIDESLNELFRYLKRPATWSEITTIANIQVDRPSAGIVHVLCKCPNGSKLNDLADKLGVESPTVTRKTQELEKSGLIKRTRSEKDRRSVFLDVTTAGRQLDQKIQRARRKLTEQSLLSWDKQERQEFVSLFNRYITGLTKEKE
jgi:DNA-binding MarR family transcriptional regulator